ncbi:hypothetical protein J5S49_09030 [Virgibacillus halodenitrificans]|uniref:hypothetical protein n=1 Tax=Virgibacillus halodenitrificans TaxID=1482 RepID=UPI00045C7B05|nr:hypothetical protein [Virgibacillus halodenitrificans]MCG1028436.1 hypothetical protein [Virgibacillus halodenitrificans]CDQ32526.1 hypothetical protein BN993_01942 [Virgibacillus halodenitrificans]
MEIGKKNLLFLRKLTATFVTTVFLSILFVLVGFFPGGFESEYNRGSQFIGWFFVYVMYIGLIILTYGNLVSLAIEYLQRKFFKQHDWLYVLILGFFGLGNGVLFQDVIAGVFGMIAAVIYGVFDKRIYERNKKGQKIKLFWVIPIVLIVFCWSCLQITSPPMPPFTKEDAVSKATSGEGSVIGDFPNTVGKSKHTIGDYEYLRETSVEEIGNEVYIVTFTEHWKNDVESGTWKLSYKVDRQSMTLSNMERDLPAYDKLH